MLIVEEWKGDMKNDSKVEKVETKVLTIEKGIKCKKW